MKLKEIEKELLVKGTEKEVKYILTHFGFMNNCELTKGELQLLHDLANRLNDTDTAAVVNNFVFTAYISSYNGGTALAGIKINKAIN
tara:strand:+ start:666 stop:926 length:261 start_codon:yes stop_codon:yes gene_type:complete